jgi:predicted dehydrogenase
MLQTEDGVTVTLEMGYAGRLEHDRFPETFVLVEGSDGSVALESDYWVRTTTEYGTLARRHAPARYSWADPAYDLVHASIVPCHRNLLQALRGAAPAETTGADNLRTLELVYAAYDSAHRGTAIDLTRDDRPERERA